VVEKKTQILPPHLFIMSKANAKSDIHVLFLMIVKKSNVASSLSRKITIFSLRFRSLFSKKNNVPFTGRLLYRLQGAIMSQLEWVSGLPTSAVGCHVPLIT